MTITEFQQDILTGLPDSLPQPKPLDDKLSHAPYRKQILSAEEKKLALKNALRYFDPKHHQELVPEFKKELETLRPYLYVSTAAQLPDLRPVDRSVPS